MTARERKRKAAIARIVAVHVESHQRLLALQDAVKFLDRPLGVRWTEEELKRIEEIKAVARKPQRGSSYRAIAPNTTRLGWMEKREDLCIDQFHCPPCEKIFYYVNDTDDTLPPKFCPECGRKNLRA